MILTSVTRSSCVSRTRLNVAPFAPGWLGWLCEGDASSAATAVAAALPLLLLLLLPLPLLPPPECGWFVSHAMNSAQARQMLRVMAAAGRANFMPPRPVPLPEVRGGNSAKATNHRLAMNQ